MGKTEITIKTGQITKFDRTTGQGSIKLVDETVTFRSTDFRSGRPTRFPTKGEHVEVVFSGDSPLSVTAIQT